MKLHELKPDPGSRRPKRRVGRGISAGQGKTAGRGTKGQKSRSGGAKAPYFEGGQLPLVRRLPFKRGFTNIFRTVYQEVNVKLLNDGFKAGADVTPQTLKEHRLIDDADKPVVILGDGELKVKLTVQRAPLHQECPRKDRGGWRQSERVATARHGRSRYRQEDAERRSREAKRR